MNRKYGQFSFGKRMTTIVDVVIKDGEYYTKEKLTAYGKRIFETTDTYIYEKSDEYWYNKLNKSA